MKVFYSILLSVTLLLSFSFYMKDDDEPQLQGFDAIYSISSVKLDVNNISTWFRNNGSFNRDPLTGNSGFEWPRNSVKFARYASGLWLGAIVNGDTLIAMAEYDYEYLPGYTDNAGNPQGKDDPKRKIYKLTKGINDSGRMQWPNKLLGNDDQGAPVYFDTKLNMWRPLDMGSQTQFFTYTDSYPESHQNRAGWTAPLKADIQQVNFAFMGGTPAGDIIFTEFKIINKSNNIWQDLYLTLWTDDDLGDATDDMIAVDTNLKLGYTYNGDNSDGVYGIAPPAVGFVYHKGPAYYTGNINDTAYYCDGKTKKFKTGYKNRGIDAFNWYAGGHATYGDPRIYYETYRQMKGLRRDGLEIINPITNQPTAFFYSGDPVTNTGWVSNPMTPGDQRFIMSTGPINLNAGDTQTIVYAQVIARGSSNLNSITKLRETTETANRIYSNCFNSSVITTDPLVSSYAPDNGKIYLTWDDNSEKTKMWNPLSSNYYYFEGYNVYQIRRGTDGTDKADRILLATYDVINNTSDIWDSVYLPEYNNWVYGKVQSGSNSGIKRFIEIDKDNFNDKPLIKGSQYYFAVTAYYYDSDAGPHAASPKIVESDIAEQMIQVIPQKLTEGTVLKHNISDTIITNRRDLGVMPFVFDPLKVISANYTSIFYKTDTLVWKLIRTMNGSTETLAENVYDFSGNHDSARVIDGLMMLHRLIRDSGVVRDKDEVSPAADNSSGKGWDYLPEGNRWVTGLDTNSVKRAKLFGWRQFQSRSMSISWPYQGTPLAPSFRSYRTRVIANGKFFSEIPGSGGVLQGGPLRKVMLVFGETQKAYRYAAKNGGNMPINVLETDTNLTNTPYIDMVNVPFSVYEIDDLDSSASPRKLNAAFIDADANGVWDPDTTALGKYQILYILASDYKEEPIAYYTTRNPGVTFPSSGFPSFDIMYAWVPKAVNKNGVPMSWTSNDKLIIYPYIKTRAEFVPGYNISYSWSTEGAVISSKQVASANNQIDKVNVFPNPYFTYSGLESGFSDRFIYFSNLPAECSIIIYSLNGDVVRKINRNEPDPERSLEKWDIKNMSGNTVASGMYIAVVDAPGVGSKVLKLAVFNNQ